MASSLLQLWLLMNLDKVRQKLYMHVTAYMYMYADSVTSHLVAWCIANEENTDTSTVLLLFQSIKERSPLVDNRVLMSDDGNACMCTLQDTTINSILHSSSR